MLVSSGLCLLVSAAAAEHVIESARDIPVAYSVDVAVVGGTSGAVEAACEAARHGARVFLLAPRPHLGTDLCANLRLWLDGDVKPSSKLAAACFSGKRVTTPLAVKATMDRALLEAGVPYLTGCFATDVLRDKDGQGAGVVMANRSGRQAVVAKVVIDATRRALVARMAGATFRPFTPGRHTFRRAVVGGVVQSGDGVAGRTMDFTCDSVAGGPRHRLPVHEYTLRLNLADNSLSSFLRAEHRARDLTYDAGSELASETLSHIPSDTVVGEGRLDTWPGPTEATLAPFRPKGLARLYVLGAHADLARKAAETFLAPLVQMAAGKRLGRAAAMEASTLPEPSGVRLPATEADGMSATVGEDLGGIRATTLGTVRSRRRALPVFGRYDVVVVGGGTSGAPAGIAAAKSGAKTLVIEYLQELCGVGTVGLIGSYWRGLRRGYTAYVDAHVKARKGVWNAVEKAEWLRRELTGSGADVWFGMLGCGAVVDDGKVRGVVIATPWGRGVVLGEVVVDATGNADVAAPAGARTRYSISERGSLNVQIAGFPHRPMKKSYVNTCYTMVDDTDVLDVWHLMTWRRQGKAAAFDVGQLIDSRERRRIVGDYSLTVHDILNRRTFPDTISQHYSNFDAAAFPDAELLLLANAKGPNFHTDLPYRCLLPKGLDGLLVVGLGASAHRDAMTLIRMQPDLQNQGYAAGLAAAAAARLGGHTRKVDIKAIQKQLIREGVLDERVQTDRDSYPMSAEAIREAIETVGKEKGSALRSLAVIVAHPRQATPLLQARYRAEPAGAGKLRVAQLLAILGDPTGVPTLIEAIDAHKTWDRGIPLTSQRKTGNTFSDLDRLVIALGYSRATEGLAALTDKLAQLEPNDALSHYKAIALALRHHPPHDALVVPLKKLLVQRGSTGHATPAPLVRKENGTVIVPGRRVTGVGGGPSLNGAYKELIVAAMLHRCGDPDGEAAAILKQYARDVHGHFARYAQAVLAGSIGSPVRAVNE
jgi:flavin-dependent dehydrogenase